MAKISLAREITISKDPLPSRLKKNFLFLTRVSSRVEIKSQKGYVGTDAFEDVYNDLELKGLLGLRRNFSNGNVRRLDVIGINLGLLDGMPLKRYHNFEVIDTHRSYYKSDLYYPTLQMVALANGYFSRQELEQRIENELKNKIVKCRKNVGFDPNTEYDELSFGMDSADKSEVENMLRDSEDELKRAKNSTCTTRGEHPSSKFRANEDGQD